MFLLKSLSSVELTSSRLDSHVRAEDTALSTLAAERGLGLTPLALSLDGLGPILSLVGAK